MARVPYIVRERKKSKIMGQPTSIGHQQIAAMPVDARLDLVRTLIPLSLWNRRSALEANASTCCADNHEHRVYQISRPR